MTLEEQFEDAQKRVNTLNKAPSQGQLLDLYGLFKQAKVGDVSGKRPGMLDLKGRAKFDAWNARQGMGREDAMKAYVSLVAELTR